MALQKEITSEAGVVYDYHRITDMNYQVKQDKTFRLSILTSSYLNQEARDNDKEPISSACFEFTTDKVLSFNEAYDLLKTTQDFTNSQDI